MTRSHQKDTALFERVLAHRGLYAGPLWPSLQSTMGRIIVLADV